MRLGILRVTIKRDLRGLWFVAATLGAWLFVGASVRRAYRKALAEDRTYCLDNPPGGEPAP